MEYAHFMSFSLYMLLQSVFFSGTSTWHLSKLIYPFPVVNSSNHVLDEDSTSKYLSSPSSRRPQLEVHHLRHRAFPWWVCAENSAREQPIQCLVYASIKLLSYQILIFISKLSIRFLSILYSLINLLLIYLQYQVTDIKAFMYIFIYWLTYY